MNLLVKKLDKAEEYLSKIDIRIWELVNNVLLRIWKIIYSSEILVNWIDNINKNNTYLFVANHPSALDLFIMKDIFERNWLDFIFIIHNNVIESKYLWDYLKYKWNLGVLNKRSEEHYLNKWHSPKKAKEISLKRFQEATLVNRKTFNDCQKVLSSGTSVLIFITWWWFSNLNWRSIIYNWYKKLATDYLKNNKKLNLLPITIDFEDGYKKGCLSIRSKIKINLLESIEINDLDSLPSAYSTIEQIYNNK